MVKSRIKLKLLLSEQKFKKIWNCRNISEKDISSLGMLMLESYRGTIDYEGESLEDSTSEIRNTINGQYGHLLKQCSFVIKENRHAISACIVTWSEEEKLPLLTFSMTHTDFKNLGMGSFLIKKSINALISQKYRELYLIVTEGNKEAQHIYEKIGFSVFE